MTSDEANKLIDKHFEVKQPSKQDNTSMEYEKIIKACLDLTRWLMTEKKQKKTTFESIGNN